MSAVDKVLGSWKFRREIQTAIAAAQGEPWFQRELLAAFDSEEGRALLAGAVGARIDTAVNAAVRGHLKRQSFREIVASVVEEVLDRRGRL